MSKTLKEQIAAVKREVAMRKSVYPKWIASNRIKPEAAEHEQECMKAVLITLVQLEAEGTTTADQIPQEPTTTYQKFVAVYDQFLKVSIGVGAKMDPIQGGALNQIIKYLVKESKDKSEAGALAAWKFIFDHWERVGPFIGKQKSIADINKNMIEILEKIMNGHDKKSASKNQLSQLKNSIINSRQSGAGDGHSAAHR